MSEANSVEQVIEKHKASGKFFTVDGIQSFALDRGSGETVFCIHGVPTSSFLYRKVIDELAGKGLRGVAIDLPGLGLADRPENFDYSFPNLARFCAKAAAVLGIEKYHLLVHDIGGPVGFALAAQNKEKILSLTILNTWIDVVNFKKPLPVRPFEKPVLGEAQLAMVKHTSWQLVFNLLGVEDSAGIPEEEIRAYVDLLKREDEGRAFLKIMRNYDYSPEFRDICYKAVRNVPYPVQAIWGVMDPGITFDRYGKEIADIAGLAEVHQLKASHLLQEEEPVAIVEKIGEIIQRSNEMLPR